MIVQYVASGSGREDAYFFARAHIKARTMSPPCGRPTCRRPLSLVGHAAAGNRRVDIRLRAVSRPESSPFYPIGGSA